MKKLLALLIALVLALPCAALAEPGTALYVSLIDPVAYQNDTVLVDATGLQLTLGALVSDVGVTAAQAFVDVGENLDVAALGAQAQIDSNGLTFSLDGMDSVYSIDLSQFTGGVDLTPMLGMLPLHTLLNTPVDFGISVDLSQPARYALLSSALAPYMDGAAVTLDRTQGELAFNLLLTAVETVTSSLNIEGMAELRAMRPAFDFNGEMTVDGDPAAANGSFTIAGAGNFYAEGLEEAVPFTLTYTDETESASLTAELGQSGTDEAAVITLNASTEEDVLVEGAMTVAGEELLNLTYSAAPSENAENAGQMDHVLSVVVPAAQTSASLLVSTGTYPEGIGFAVDLFVDTPGMSLNPYIYYNGEKTVDELGAEIFGSLVIGSVVNGLDYGLDTYLWLQSASADTSTWAYDSTGAIALETMDETQSAALSAGMMGVVGNAATAIMENVPGLAPMVEAAMGSMMG